MNYYQQKQQSDLAAAKAQIAQSVAHYEYPSENELASALLELKKLRLKQDVRTLGKVIDHLDRASGTKKSCGCTGKSASAGKYETKSLSKGSTRPAKSNGLFASAYEQVQADAAYEAFEAFCSKFPYMCNER